MPGHKLPDEIEPGTSRTTVTWAGKCAIRRRLATVTEVRNDAVFVSAPGQTLMKARVSTGVVS
jgi:hypothetical protein